MVFNHKNYKTGDLRAIKYFAFVPKTVRNQTRWLETVYVLQEYVKDTIYCDDGEYGAEEPYNFWKDVRFLKEYEYDLIIRRGGLESDRNKES